jgi:hypothetical protein
MRRWPAAALLLCTIPLVFAATETRPLLWADFKEPLQSHLGAPVQSLAMSERSGDAVAGPMRVVDSNVVVEGRLSQANASQWATLGLEVGGEVRGQPVDLRGYEHMRIRLASSTPRVLRIRLKGTDPQTLNAGCYPVMMQRVGPQSTDYVIPLAAFGAESFCGERGTSVQQTLPAVARVEVTANEPSNEPVRFQVGRIEFLGELSTKAKAEPSVTAAASATAVNTSPSSHAARKAAPPEAPRRRTHAEPHNGQTVRQVTCERNTRYGLMMCY